MNRILILAIVLPGSALAQDWAVRDGDRTFDVAGLEAAITGQRLTFFDDGESRFSGGGSYSYTYGVQNGGGTQFGTWAVSEDGVICIDYRNGASRCDMYVQAGGRWVVLTEEGDRYPVRP